MIELEPTLWKPDLLQHQIEGVRKLITHKAFALFDEMGVGKSKQVIDAAYTLYRNNLIRAVVVICPAAVRGVWDDPETGELQKFSWMPFAVKRFTSWDPFIPPPPEDHLYWIVSNYELLRYRDHLQKFIKQLGKLHPFLLVLDESSRIKSRTAQQTKAIRKIRQFAARCVILNGTPIANNLLDLWAQFDILDPEAIYNMNYWQFQAEYCLMMNQPAMARTAQGVVKRWTYKKVIGYNENAVKSLTTRLDNWVLRREKDQCLDLPPKTYTHLEVTLSKETFRLYIEMYEQMVAWVGDDYSVATHGAIKIMRMAQLCSGFLGGFDIGEPPREIGREKLDALLEFVDSHPIENLLIWCRFTAEINRAVRELSELGRRVFTVAGGQTDATRQFGINEFQQTQGSIIVGQPQAGGWGLNLTRAHTVVYLSNDYNYVSRKQSEDRAHRKGQEEKVTYVDFLAVTPKGRHTTDHMILNALQRKENMATWTMADWKKSIADLGKE